MLSSAYHRVARLIMNRSITEAWVATGSPLPAMMQRCTTWPISIPKHSIRQFLAPVQWFLLTQMVDEVGLLPESSMLSPTRTYAPVVKEVLDSYRPVIQVLCIAREEPSLKCSTSLITYTWLRITFFPFLLCLGLSKASRIHRGGNLQSFQHGAPI